MLDIKVKEALRAPKGQFRIVELDRFSLPGEEPTIIGDFPTIQGAMSQQMPSTALLEYFIYDDQGNLAHDAIGILKGPPGPPPRPGLIWWEPTHRWRDPETEEEEKHTGPYFTPEGQSPLPGFGGAGIDEATWIPPVPPKWEVLLDQAVDDIHSDQGLLDYIEELGDAQSEVQNLESEWSSPLRDHHDEIYDALQEKQDEAIDIWATAEMDMFIGGPLAEAGTYSQLQDLQNELDSNYYFDTHGNGYLEMAAEQMQEQAKALIEEAFEHATDDQYEDSIDEIMSELDLEGAEQLGLDASYTKHLQNEINDYVRNHVQSIGQGERGDVKNHLVIQVMNNLEAKIEADPELKEAFFQYWKATKSPNTVGKSPNYEIVDNLVHTWATTSADAHDTALAMQQAAIEEFDLIDAASMHLKHTQVSKDLATMHGTVFRAFHRAQYEHTQGWLKERGISEVTVYRGAGVERNKIPGSRGGVGTLSLQPISSVSLSRSTAGEFTGHGSTGTPTLNLFKIPAERILSTCVSGYGCLNEQELTVLGGDYPGLIVNVEMMESGSGAEELIDQIYERIEGQKVPGTFARSLALIKAGGDPINLDADLFNADWSKRTWDFSHINSKMELISHLKMMGMSWAAFQRLPVFQMNVERLPWLTQNIQKGDMDPNGDVYDEEMEELGYPYEADWDGSPGTNMPFHKGPPGPPPRPGLQWKEETHRWIRPEEVEQPEVLGNPMSPRYKVEWSSLGNITPEEQEALEYYLDDSGYMMFNNILRGKKTYNQATQKNVGEHISHIKSAMTKQITTKNVRVFRGIGKSISIESLGVGTIFQDAGFISTSTDKDVADEFMTGKIILDIIIPKNSYFAFGSSKEQEVILPPNSKFKVTAVKPMPIPTGRLTPGQRKRLEGRYSVSMVLL